MQVTDRMTPDPICGHPEMPVTEAQALMREKNIPFALDIEIWYNQYLRIWDPECRRKPASGLVKADWRPHSSEFSHLLIIEWENSLECGRQSAFTRPEAALLRHRQACACTPDPKFSSTDYSRFQER